MHCEKCQKIILRKQDGTQEEISRCVNTASCTYRKKVNVSDCAACVLRVPIIFQISTCGEKPPQKPIYKQPVFGSKDEIIYEIIGSNPPPCPLGYKQDGWTFYSDWIKCPQRIQLNKLTPIGDVQINCFCGFTKHSITPIDCENCQLDLSNVSNEELLSVPDMPSLSEQLSHYWQAVKKWISGGRPVRSNGEVEKIHADYCTRCDWYERESQKCKGCGCNVKSEGIVLLNKIKMATEHCPRNFW